MHLQRWLTAPWSKTQGVTSNSHQSQIYQTLHFLRCSTASYHFREHCLSCFPKGWADIEHLGELPVSATREGRCLPVSGDVPPGGAQATCGPSAHLCQPTPGHKKADGSGNALHRPERSALRRGEPSRGEPGGWSAPRQSRSPGRRMGSELHGSARPRSLNGV